MNALQKALNELPQYKKLQTALSAVEAAKAAHIASKPVARNGSDVIAAIVENGEVDLVAIDALSTTAAELQHYAAVEGFLFSASQSIKSQQESLIKQNAKKLLANLTDQLQAIVDEVATLAPKLVGVNSADDAIRLDAAAEYKRAGELTEAYKQIRSARAKVGKGNHIAHWLDLYLEVSDPLAVWPEYFDHIDRGAVTYMVDGAQRSRSTIAPFDEVSDLSRLLWYSNENVELQLRSDSDAAAVKAEDRNAWQAAKYGAPVDLVHNSKARARKPKRRSSVDRASEALLEIVEEDA